MGEQRALFFVRKGVGHALHFARTEVFDNGNSRERTTWTGSPKGERAGTSESIFDGR
jgi:hypothetical protein